MTNYPDAPTIPEDVADVLTLGVLEQLQARMPAIYGTLSRLAPAGGVLASEERVRVEGIAAGLAVCILHLEKRLSPGDLHRVYLRAEYNCDQMTLTLSTHLWWYYFTIRGGSGEARLRALCREFLARCYDLEPDALPEHTPDAMSLASLLVPKGSAAFAIDIGRLLRSSG